MRLIDVERMIFKIPAELTERQRLRILNIIGESIEQTPTVEAIPIEWIKTRIEPLYWTADGRGVQDVAYWLIDEWHKE